MRVWEALGALGLASLAVVAESSCNVETKGLDLVTAIEGELDADELNLINTVRKVGESIRLTEDDGVGGSPSSFWFNDRQRLTDGFSVSFIFQIEGGKADGFAFVIQNDKINDIRSSVGPNLGYRNGIANYLAVGFDLCSSRGEADGTDCAVEQVRIDLRQPGGFNENLAEATLENSQFMKDGNKHTVTVNYLQDELKINVFVDDDKVVDADLPLSLEQLFKSRLGFFGFTGSTLGGGFKPITVDIDRFTLRQIDADSKISDDVEFDTVVEFNKRVAFRLDIVDSCNDKVSKKTVESRNITEDEVEATLSTINPNNDNNERIFADVKIDQRDDGSFDIFFQMPNNVASEWDLDVKVNDIRAQNMPAKDLITTVEPNAGGLNRQSVILLSCLIVLLVIVTIYMVRRLDKYRQQLKKHKEDIEYGKTKEQIDIIDADVQYTMNPMIAPLDEMKERLQRNEEILARLRSGIEDAMDSNYTIDQLAKENEQLRQEMNKLKKEEQLREANTTGLVGRARKFLNMGTERKEFDQQKG